MSQIKILIVEDEAAIAQDLSDILSLNGYQVIGVAHNYKKALDILKIKKPDLALLDISLQGNESGIDIAKVINKEYNIPFIFITSYSDDNTLEEVLETKPNGYIVKPYKEEDINPIVKVALMQRTKKDNDVLLTREMINKIVEKGISKQEYKILTHLWTGMKYQQIASQLFISVNTVKTHVIRLYQKTGVNSRAQLMNKLMEMAKEN